MNGVVVSIWAGRPQEMKTLTHTSQGRETAKVWTSAIVKSPVVGSVTVGRTNLVGDEQADLVHHGGPDKALLAYPERHYADWIDAWPDVGFGPGGFGENLTVRGIDEAACCIGDTFRVGDCSLQISQPRQPCWKLASRWGLPKLVTEVQRTGRTGWYFRVLVEGVIESGMAMVLQDRPFPAWTVAQASAVMYAKPRSKEDDVALAACPALSQSWQETLARRAAQGRAQ